MNYYIKADSFFMHDGIKKGGYLEILDGKFGSHVYETPQNVEIADYTGKFIAPGLVDTHIHGYKNHDVMDADVEGLHTISEGLLSMGVTSFLATTLTASVEKLNEVCSIIGDNYSQLKGAKLRGIFLEGPYFTEKYKGAQNPNYFSDPSIKDFDNWQQLSKNLIRKIALAPEREGVEDFIKYVTKNGVHVALGHSDAKFDEAINAVDAGADIFVHTYNAMSGLHHRDPGMVGAAMISDSAVCELICDGHHVHPAAAKILVKIKTSNKVALVTDCMSAGGMPEGNYKLGEFPVVVKDGTARLLDSGNLAGSILKLYEGVRNVVSWDIVGIEDAIKMGSTIPAMSVGINDSCGIIKSGYDADFIVIDKNINLCETYLNGVSRYKA